MARIFSALRNFHADQRAQDAFEYVLIIGGVSVAVIIAIASPLGGSLIDAVIAGTCGAIDGIVSVSC